MNVRPRPSQSRALIPLSYRSFDFGLRILNCGLMKEPIRIPHSPILNRLAEGTGLEPASDKCAVVFGTTALPVRLPFRTFPIFNCRLPIDSESERPIGNHQLAIGNELVHVVGLAPTKDNQVRLIYSQVPLLLSHTCAHRISDFKSQREISNLRSICAKK